MYVVNFSGRYVGQKDASNTWNASNHILETTVVRNDNAIEIPSHCHGSSCLLRH